MHDGGFSVTEALAIYEECVFLVRNFSHVIIEHCSRERNIVAHLLAAHVEGSQTCVWTGDPPAFIVPRLVDDVTMFKSS